MGVWWLRRGGRAAGRGGGKAGRVGRGVGWVRGFRARVGGRSTEMERVEHGEGEGEEREREKNQRQAMSREGRVEVRRLAKSEGRR
ncbi:hypothetical protein Syun_021506 [Stephania yunnanensis]|uniref:Uncharacterized protein n=1 Tax=Stephania yunnanensis TaxID=152371 RepID=A0AAP0IFQ4_9MAGN